MAKVSIIPDSQAEIRDEIENYFENEVYWRFGGGLAFIGI